MKAHWSVSIVAAVTLLAACGGDDRAAAPIGAGDTIVGGPGMGVGQGPGGTMAPGAPGTAAPGMGATVQLQPVGDAGFAGEATVSDRGNQVEVMVRLTGTPGNSTHNGHIHSGRCDSIGGVVQPLQPISTDAAGTGTMTTTVDLAPMAVMDGGHVIVYHAVPGPPASCAEIPQHTM